MKNNQKSAVFRQAFKIYDALIDNGSTPKRASKLARQYMACIHPFSKKTKDAIWVAWKRALFKHHKKHMRVHMPQEAGIDRLKMILDKLDRNRAEYRKLKIQLKYWVNPEKARARVCNYKRKKQTEKNYESIIISQAILGK